MVAYKKKNIFRLLAMMLVAVFFVLALQGCFLLPGYVKSIEFSTNKIVLTLGDEIDLYDYLNISPTDTNAGITVISQNKNIASSNYALRLKALGVGKTSIKATAGGKESTCNIEVVYNTLTRLQIFSYGDLYQTSDQPTAIDFVAEANEYVKKDYRIAWYIDEIPQHIIGDYFSFTPASNASKSYKIEARIEDTNISDSVEIGVFEPSHNPIVRVTQEAGKYSFLPTAEGLWEYSVNGETVYNKGGDGSFTFEPRDAGIYSIECNLYGLPCKFEGGQQKFIVKKTGSVSPLNLRLEYDNCYPNSYLLWDIKNVYDPLLLDYYVKITDSSSESREFSSVGDAHLFDGTSFNSSGIIDITKQYTVEVSCKASGTLNGETKASLVTEKIPSSALPYLNKKFLDKNYYISSDLEFFEIYEYTLWMRNETTETKKSIYSNVSLYIAYNSELEANKLMRLAWARCAQSGLYYLGTPTAEAKKGKLLSFKITYASDNAPSLTTDIKNYSRTLMQPHLNYESAGDRELYIERLPLLDDEVKDSNELFYIVEKGFRPNTKEGSKAEELYNYARKLLKNIITDDMDDLEKIHAIYDWILWRTHYDKEVIKIEELEYSVKYEAYYLESVLTDDYPFTVCDGLSKTFSLLCNMEGIKCVRVVGKANTSANKWGEHAWNKVFFEGEWYLVDCTWGDSDITINGKDYESGSHQYLMRSYGELNDSHSENTLGGYPQAAKKPFLFFRREFSYNGVSANLSIFDGINLESKLNAIINYTLAHRPLQKTYTIGSGSYSQTSVDFYGTDFMVASHLSLEVETLIRNILTARGILESIVYGFSDKYMYILIKY